ncbi:MAG: (d)CMP kinase [Kiritimatiellia bacterium]
MTENKYHVIAIDGPSASGKSTVSKKLAQVLDYLYVDSGALYRGMTWKMLQENVDIHNTAAVVAKMDEVQWDFFIKDGAVWFSIDGTDPGQEIRGEAVRENVAIIATIPEVRAFIVEQLRNMRHFGNIVMEGRDIGSVVFRDSPYKFYIDADPKERARRRCKDIVQLEGQSNEEEVFKSLERRDAIDSSRKTAPLKIVDGARVLDTTGMSIDQVVARIADDLRKDGLC